MTPLTLLQRLKERKLVQWALAYLAGAFFVYTGLDPARETWGIPETVIRGIHILLIAGFLITLVLAWYHGEKGRQRVSGPELLMVAALLVVAGVALTLLSGTPGTPQGSLPSSEGGEPRVAVLPCANFSPNPEDAFRAEGLHEEILLRLQGISSLLTIGRTSVLRFAEDPPPVAEIAGILPADFVGECSVLKEPDHSQIRVTFQLLDASGVQVWADSYDRDLTVANLFDIQSEIASRVAREVGAAVTPADEARLTSRPTESTEAYDAFQMARYLNSRLGSENARRAIGIARQAIELDPGFSEAYAELAQAYRNLGWYTGTIDPAPLADSIQAAFERAIELDDQNAEAYARFSFFLLHWRWDLLGAEAAMQRALLLDPTLPIVRYQHAILLYSTGRYEEALTVTQKALLEDPFGISINNALGVILFKLGRYDEELVQDKKTLDLDPSNPVYRSNLGHCYLRENMPDSALAEFGRLDMEEFPSVAGGLIRAHLQLGNRDAAIRTYEELRSLADRIRISKTAMANALLPLDESQAFDLFAQAVQDRDPRLLDSLWGSDHFEDPRVRGILNSMGLDLDGERLVAFEGGS